MKNGSFSISKKPKNPEAGKSRAKGRIAFSLFCAALVTAAPLSDALARGGFGGGGFGGGGFGGGGFGHSYDGGMSGRSAGYDGWNQSRSYWRSSERGPLPPASGRNPGRYRGPIYGRPVYGSPVYGSPVYGSPWRHPVYGGSAPVYAAPVEPVHGGFPPVHKSLQGVTQPHNPPPPPVTQTAQRTQSGVPAATETRFVPDEVMFTVNGPSQIAETIGQKHHLALISSQSLSLMGGRTVNRYRITDKRAVPDVIRDLEKEQQITWAQPNYIFKLEGVEIAPQSLVSAQYALTKMHLEEAHRVTEGGKTLVAIIDSGIDENHPDIAGAVVGHFDALGGETQAHAHGTAIAGAISAHGALVGAAPQANILAIRAFSGIQSKPGADATTAHILAGLNFAYEHRAKIVNMSFAGAFDPLLAQAIGSAHQNGMSIVAAAGNEGPAAKPAYPASDPNVIAVTATDRDDKLFSAANHGSYISLAAPGTEILSAAPSNSYQFSSGTSIAAAEISGVVALLLAEKPDLTDDMIRQILKETAHDLHGSSPDEFGAGLGDAEKAVAAAALLREHGKIADAKSE